MGKKWMTAILAGASLAAFAAGPAQKIVYGLSGEAQTLDPGLNQYFRSSIVLHSLFTGLERMAPDGKVVPGMASSFSLDKSKTVYTFKIADGAKWSDGKPLTAQDFEYAWKRVLNPKTASPASWYLYYLKNGKPASEGKVPLDEVGVKALNPRTLKVTLENPTPYFLDLLCVSAFFPVRKDVVEGPEPWTRSVKTYINNGPFTFEAIRPKEKYVMKKNPDYLYASQVKLQSLEMIFIEAAEAQLAAYQTGEVQVLDDPSPEGQKKYQGTPELARFPRIGMCYYDFNTAKKPFDDARVRQAFSLAVNRGQVTKYVLQTGEKPALGFVPYGIPDGAKKGKQFREVAGDPCKEDVGEARKLLAAAGYPNGRNFPGVTLICQSNQLAKDVAQAFQAMWKANLGITVNIQTFESKVYWNQMSVGNFNIGADGWTGDYADPMTNLEIFETKNNTTNNRWSSAAFDGLIAANRSLADQKVRMANFAKAEKILAAEMPIMPVYYYQGQVLSKPNVKGVVKTYLGHTVFEHAHVE